MELIHLTTNQTLDETLGLVLSGQLLRFSIPLMLLINSAWFGPISNYSSVKHIKTLEDIFKNFNSYIDGYVSFLDIRFGIEEDSGNNYKFFNELMLDKRLLIPAMTEEHLTLCYKYNIPQSILHPEGG